MNAPGVAANTVDQVQVWLDDVVLGGAALVGHLARRPSRTGDTIHFRVLPKSRGWKLLSILPAERRAVRGGSAAMGAMSRQ